MPKKIMCMPNFFSSARAESKAAYKSAAARNVLGEIARPPPVNRVDSEHRDLPPK